MGFFRDNETNNWNGTDHAYKSQLLGGESIGYFTSVAEDLNPGLPRTNPASGQGGTWTRGLRITSPALYPLGHATSTIGCSVKWTKEFRIFMDLDC